MRIVPLFPELRRLMLDVFESALEGAEHIITRYRDSTVNLGTQFRRIIRRAGFEPWPRLWQNLRASRETELMRCYDLATVCKWIGNSPAVAARHYAMSADLDADFRRAAGMIEEPSKAQQKAQQSPSAEGCQAMTTNEGMCEDHQENKGNVADSQLVTIGDDTNQWAILDLNQ